MVRIVTSTDPCLGDVTVTAITELTLRPPLPRINDLNLNNNNNIQHQEEKMENGMDIKLKCCEESKEVVVDSGVGTNQEANGVEIDAIPELENGNGHNTPSPVKVPIIVIEELPLTDNGNCFEEGEEECGHSVEVMNDLPRSCPSIPFEEQDTAEKDEKLLQKESRFEEDAVVPEPDPVKADAKPEEERSQKPESAGVMEMRGIDVGLEDSKCDIGVSKTEQNMQQKKELMTQQNVPGDSDSSDSKIDGQSDKKVKENVGAAEEGQKSSTEEDLKLKCEDKESSKDVSVNDDGEISKVKEKEIDAKEEKSQQSSEPRKNSPQKSPNTSRPSSSAKGNANSNNAKNRHQHHHTHHHNCPAFNHLHIFPLSPAQAQAAAAMNLSNLLTQAHLNLNQMQPLPNFPQASMCPHPQVAFPPPPLSSAPGSIHSRGPQQNICPQHQFQHQGQRQHSPTHGNNLSHFQQGPGGFPTRFPMEQIPPGWNGGGNGNGLNGGLGQRSTPIPNGMQQPPPPEILGAPPALPLPTAIIPLPLDPSLPPVVLPSFPSNATTPNTQSTSSGYSTAGHSRSSSPINPNGNNGLPPLIFDNGLLPLPPQPPSASGGQGQSPNFVVSAATLDLSIYPQFFPNAIGQFVVYFHINPGVSVSFTVGGQTQVVKGPMTVPLVSTNSSAPIPLPMQVPQGHVVQQIVDENGTLRHVIVSPQPPLMPIPNYPTNSQGQQFYPSGPGGYPAHFSPMQPGVIPCPVPSPHGGPPGNGGGAPSYSNSIPVHAQKDERTTRQFLKLRRKYEQKQQTSTSYNNGSGYAPQTSSIRKETGYAAGTTARKTNGVSSKSPANGGVEEDGSVGSNGSVTSNGTQDEEEEHRTVALTELLSSIIPLTVTEVTARTAYVQWSHPDRISETGENKFPDLDASDNDFRYEVFINEKSRDSRFRSIFVGTALSCRVKDLKPGSIYAITYCAMLGDVKGQTCTPTSFTTPPAEPEPPSSPRAVSRSRSGISLKWNAPVTDNGAKINYYVLEYDDGKGGDHFVEAYKGKNKQCTVSKLQPAYSYQFRLAAVNDIGKSRYTNVTNAMTAGSPPTQPAPPQVAEAGVKYLRLEWRARDTDDEYTLQMEDPASGHGYLNVYNGSAPNYLCIGLKRNYQYRFRLRAQNEEGHSKWSDEVVICTLPDRPGPPHKPGLKGRVHAYGFRVRWDPPADNGGTPIHSFSLEIDKGNGYEEIYRGPDTECGVDRLSPGQSYALRAIAVGPGGGSDPSESCVITTEPVCPGKSHIPRVIGKPKSNSVHLKWSPPEWSGGSPVNMYEVGCTTPDNQTHEAYRGKETECIVSRLLPGRAYLFQIRAFNRIGPGEWSDPLEVVSGAGAPDAPVSPKVVTKTSHIALITWNPPLNNGSAVTEYRVQMAMPLPPAPAQPTTPTEEPKDLDEAEHLPSSKAEDGNDDAGEEAKTEVKTSSPAQPSVSPPPTSPASVNTISTFSQVYIGAASSCEVKGLQPSTMYLFRVQAVNAAGPSDWSPVITHEMPASSPNGVSGVEAIATSSSISLVWKTPLENGSSITHYNVMMGETLLVASSNQITMDNLMPDTQYKIRVQAVNSVGPGPYSTLMKVWTKPLAPPPPKLECIAVAHFWLKLKWTEVATPNKNVEYLVQMINPYKDEFEVVYRGTVSNAKVTRLNEDTEYQFRICAINAAGQGPFSDLYHFSTSKAPPSQVKGCKYEAQKDANIHRFEWFEVTCNSSDTIEYQFQMATKKRDMDFKTFYRGTERRVDISHSDLDVGADYACRVCAIRVAEDGTQLVGPYSNNVNFHVPHPSQSEDLLAATKTSFASKSSIRAPTFISKAKEALSTISYESQVGIMAVIALIILAFVISLITHHVVS